MASVRNIFTIGRRRRDEDQLTEMLVWLIEAVPEVGDSVVRLAFGDDVESSDMSVTTQHGVVKGRLDALFVASTFALVVESKLDSAYGDDQLGKYLDWLASSHGHRAQRCLMTLTAREAPWSEAELKHADRLEINACICRWEELHGLLQPLIDDADREISARLVKEFLDMLSDEELIPMQPFRTEERQTWRDAEKIVLRFHKYFRACKEAIGQALEAKASSNAWSESPGYTWQDYALNDSTKIAVGLQASDEERVHRQAVRLTPMVWVAVEAKDWPDWSHARDRLATSPPDGWQLSPSLWLGERPMVWRYLDDVVGDGTFEEQRDRLAAECRVGVVWLRSAKSLTVS